VSRFERVVSALANLFVPAVLVLVFLLMMWLGGDAGFWCTKNCA
jgi:hypothetical protein